MKTSVLFKILLIILSVFTTVDIFAQVPTRAQLQKVNFPYMWPSGGFKTVLYLPLDTAVGAEEGAKAWLNGVEYTKGMAAWYPTASGGTFIGDNMANHDLDLTGNRTHNGKRYRFMLDTLGYLRYMVYRNDPFIPNNVLNTFFHLDSSITGSPYRIVARLRNTTNTADSIISQFGSNESSIFMQSSGLNGARFGVWQFIGNSDDPRTTFDLNGGGKYSQYVFGHTATLNPGDSVRIKADAALSAPKMMGLRSESGGLYTPVAVDMGNFLTGLTGEVNAAGPGVANATLSNTGVIPGTYTNPTLTIDARGRVSLASNGSTVKTPIDVFLIAGQSNAMGKGDSTLSPKVPGNILQVNTGIITRANDPVGKNIGTSGSQAHYGSAWPAFGNTYFQTTGNNIAFIPSSYDGSAQTAAAEYLFGNWDNTGVLFDSAVARVNSGLTTLINAGYAPTLKGVLWCQGEADGKAINRGLITQADYIAAFKNMIGKFRTQLNYPKLPFLVFRTGTKTDTLDTGYRLVRDAQQSIAAIDTFNVRIVFYNAIDYPQRGLMSDVAHFTQAGYNEMGTLGAAAVVSGRVFNIDDVLITENNKLKTNRAIDLNGKAFKLIDSTTGYTYIDAGSNNRTRSGRTFFLSDTLLQENIVAKNSIRGETVFGDRNVEGTPFNYFVKSPLVAYTEGYLSANPSNQVASFAPARYARLNDGAAVSYYGNIYSQAVPRIRGSVTMFANGGNGIASCYAHQYNYVFTRASDFTAPPVIRSDSAASQSNSNFNLSFGLLGAGDIQAKGWYSNYSSQLTFTGGTHVIENFADFVAGKLFTGAGAGSISGKRVGYYIAPIYQTYTPNAYAIYQEGGNDTNYFFGKIRIPNLAQRVDTTNYKPIVVDAAGNLFKMGGWSGSGGSTPTLDNVLTAGTTLTNSYTISNSTNLLSFTTTAVGLAGYQFNNTAGGSAVDMSANGTGNTTTISNSSSGVGAQISSVSGTAVGASSTSGLAVSAAVNPSSTNTVENIIRLARSTSGTAAAGLGGAINLRLEQANGGSVDALSLQSILTDATSGAIDADISLQTALNGTVGEVARFKSDGTAKLNTYGTLSHTGTPAADLAVSSSGDIIEKKISSFAATASQTVTNTTTETTLIGSGTGSLTITPSEWIPGKTYRIKLYGVLATDGSNPGTTNFRVKLGSVTLCTSGGIFHTAGTTGRYFEVDVEFTCRTTGASGTVMAQGQYRDKNAAINSMDNGGSTATIDMTTNQTLDLTLQWSQAAAGNTCTSNVVMFRPEN